MIKTTIKIIFKLAFLLSFLVCCFIAGELAAEMKLEQLYEDGLLAYPEAYGFDTEPDDYSHDPEEIIEL